MRMKAMAAAMVAGMLSAGGAAIAASLPPQWVETYIAEHPVDSISVEGRVQVGTRIPEEVALNPIPGFDYAYVVVEGLPVLVHPVQRQIVYVYR